MRNKKIIKFLTFTLVFVLFILAGNIKTYAWDLGDNGVSYSTYTMSNDGLIPTQEAYIVKNEISKIKIKNSTEFYTLVKPVEQYYEDNSNYLYIVDEGNIEKSISPYILRTTSDFEDVELIGEGILKNPQGVFVTSGNNKNDTSDDLIYVADYGLQEVVVFDFLGNVVKRFSKPTHPLYGQNMEFKPSKIIVDHVGTMYIVDSGNGNGLVQLTSDGEFLGYFGANYTAPDFGYIIKFMFASKEQKKKLYRTPIVPTNIAIDNDGLINTVTKNIKDSPLKRLNIAGDNLLNPTLTYMSPYYNDLSVGKINNIYTVTVDGYIFEYDVNGDLLFTFGGTDKSGKYIGLFVNPLSIEADNNYNLYVIDNNKITIFTPTKFCNYVHEAINLYQNGLYDKSREPWEKVLQLNNMFDLAHKGIGKAYLIQQNYEEALYHFELAKDVKGYSDAYWELRNEFLMNKMGTIIIALLIIVVIYYILKFLEKKQILKSIGYIKDLFINIKNRLIKIKFFREIGQFLKFIKHPIDGFYEIKKHNAISFTTALLLYIIFFIELVLAKVFTGFIFNPQDTETISILNIATQYMLPILLFVICHYLISSITVGNGKFKDVFASTIASFAPLMLFMPIIVFLSNFLTLNESFIYSFSMTALWGWSFILLFFMIKEIEELEFGETISNILLTAVTMLLFVAFAFLLYALASQIVNFVVEFVMEVISNG